MSAALSKRSQKKKKNASAQGSLKFREVSNSFWELLTYLLTQLVSQTKTCVVVMCFPQVFRSSFLGRKVCRFQLCHQFLTIFLLGRDVLMSQMSLYIRLNHCGYQ